MELKFTLFTVYKSKKLERVQMFFNRNLGISGKGVGEIIYSPSKKKTMEHWTVITKNRMDLYEGVVGRRAKIHQ